MNAIPAQGGPASPACWHRRSRRLNLWLRRIVGPRRDQLVAVGRNAEDGFLDDLDNLIERIAAITIFAQRLYTEG